jgi:hypothetical protein
MFLQLHTTGQCVQVDASLLFSIHPGVLDHGVHNATGLSTPLYPTVSIVDLNCCCVWVAAWLPVVQAAQHGMRRVVLVIGRGHVPGVIYSLLHPYR